jgi:UDP-N-acetylglucosamine diphosphorylase/glucosamine-1-phosphate N-acetyltransferase
LTQTQINMTINYILFDDSSRSDLLPLTFVRPIADIRFGILTIREKWEHYLDAETSTLTERYLSGKFPLVKGKNNILINASVCPNKELVKQIKSLKPDESLVAEEYIIALHVVEKDLDALDSSETDVEEVEKLETDGLTEIPCDIPHLKLNFAYDIFAHNQEAIEADFAILTSRRKSKKLSETNHLLCENKIFAEEGVKAEFATINATNGPVYIGKGVEIMEGAMIRGPVAICDGATIKMGAKIYGPTTIGPVCKVGGELNNVVMFGYTNKAHDGFIGHSVIGEWCNIGADTNNSNLKNTYDEVKLWSYPLERFISTGLKFCGLIMGDHSKCGINTMFNTGTVVGVNANIFGHGYQRNFIPSFSWGTSASGYTTYDIGKAIDVARFVFERRGKIFEDVDVEILKTVYNLTFTYRKKRL